MLYGPAAIGYDKYDVLSYKKYYINDVYIDFDKLLEMFQAGKTACFRGKEETKQAKVILYNHYKHTLPQASQDKIDQYLLKEMLKSM